jgi:hypothetical protein
MLLTFKLRGSVFAVGIVGGICGGYCWRCLTFSHRPPTNAALEMRLMAQTTMSYGTAMTLTALNYILCP